MSDEEYERRCAPRDGELITTRYSNADLEARRSRAREKRLEEALGRLLGYCISSVNGDDPMDERDTPVEIRSARAALTESP